MASQLPRPGVEVVQEFQSTSPTVVTPALVPCVVAPYFELIEVLNSDGTANSDALVADPYQQLELTIPQASLPSPRGNIDEVDVDEDSIRAFLEWGGTLVELQRDEAFLLDMNVETLVTDDQNWHPWLVSSQAEEDYAPAGFDLDGRKLKLQFDSHQALPPAVDGTGLLASADVEVTFAATTVGSPLTISEVVAQINAVIPGAAYVANSDGTPWTLGDHHLGLKSTRYGAGASVVVRYVGADANVILGFCATNLDEFAIGPGFYAVDDSDGDLTSARLQLYGGNLQGPLGTPGSAVVVTSNYDFISMGFEAGDTIYADGVNIGDIEEVATDRLTMEVEQNLMTHANNFAPHYFWAQAKDLSYPAPAASTEAIQTGTVPATAAVPAYIVSQLTPTLPIALGESLTLAGAEDGVAMADETLVASVPWADVTTAVTDINSTAINFQAFEANDAGDEVAAGNGTHVGLRTLPSNTGSGSVITYVQGTTGMTLGYTANTQDIGENIRYRDGTPAWQIQGGVAIPETWVAGGAVVATQTIVYTPTVLGVAKGAETIEWTLSHAGDAAGLTAAIADWNSQAIFTEAYESNNAGVETALGGYFAIRTKGENIGVTAIIDITATDTGATLPDVSVGGAAVVVNGTTFKWSIDKNSWIYEVILNADEDDSGVSQQQIIDKVNELTPGVAAASTSSPPALMLESNKVGGGSEIEVHDGTANVFLGFTDDVSEVGNGRPAPDLAIDISGNALLSGQVLRDGLTGWPFAGGFAPLYMAYKALRLDMSPAADNPDLITWNDVGVLEQVADPISLDNPGSLMSYLALLNAPGVSVASIGVPEVSADAPDGTPLGYARCAEFLESKEVYAIAVASQSAVVHQAWLTHVDFMSEPEQKGERVLIFNPEEPDRENPTSVGSGTDANSTGVVNEVTLDVNIAPALIAAGIDPNAPINPDTGAIENEVYLDLGGDDNVYLVKSVANGIDLVLRTAFATGDGNADSFYSTSGPGTVISDDWSVYIRGDSLTIPGSDLKDRDAVAETIQGAASAYGNRRGYMVFPDTCAFNVGGLEQQGPGYYAAACVAGMSGSLPPQQGFTNYPITGLTTVLGSNDNFTNRQMNVMAAGGVYILVQDTQGAPVLCRHQLSTDTSSIEKREFSITKVVDYTAKFIRAGLRNFIGRYNITPAFIDQLSTVVQGLIAFLVDNHVLIGADINNIMQDENAPDTILIDVTLDVPYPCNYIRVTLIV